jgi:hypothetical protein
MSDSGGEWQVNLILYADDTALLLLLFFITQPFPEPPQVTNWPRGVPGGHSEEYSHS